MRKTLYILMLLASAIICGCDKLIEEFDFGGEKVMCVNAVLNNASHTNYIYCRKIEGTKISFLNDATIRIYVNGELRETITDTAMAPGTYITSVTFGTGDIVRCEVESPSINAKAYAEETVPELLEVEGIDTTATGYYNEESPLKTLIHLKGKQDGCYRIVGFWETSMLEEIIRFNWDSKEIYSRKDSLVSSGPQYVYDLVDDDIALTEGKGYLAGWEEDEISLEIHYRNHFRQFSGSYFTNGKYTISVNLKKPRKQPFMIEDCDMGYGIYCDEPESEYYMHRYTETDFRGQFFRLINKESHRKTGCLLISMPETEYRYMKGVSAQYDIRQSYSEPLVEPVILPCNFHGARGIFAVENSLKYNIEIE